jgi:hypothetical protein
MKQLDIYMMLKNLVRDLLTVTIPMAISYKVFSESLQEATTFAIMGVVLLSLVTSLIFHRKSCLFDGNLRITYLKEADKMNYLLEIFTPLDEVEHKDDVRLKVVNEDSQN